MKNNIRTIARVFIIVNILLCVNHGYSAGLPVALPAGLPAALAALMPGAMPAAAVPVPAAAALNVPALPHPDFTAAYFRHLFFKSCNSRFTALSPRHSNNALYLVNGPKNILMKMLLAQLELARDMHGQRPIALVEAFTSSNGLLRQEDHIQQLISETPLNAAFAPYGETVLHILAEKGKASAISILCEAGADVNKQRAIDGSTALHIAVLNNRYHTVQALLDNGAHVNVLNNEQKSPLFIAAQYGYLPITQLLIARGADKTQRDNRNYLPLFVAVQAVDNAELVTLLACNDINEQFGPELRTCLHEAVAFQHFQVINALLNIPHIAVNAQDINGITPCHLASARNVHILKLLLAHQANYLFKDNKQGTTLHYAAGGSDIQCVSELLSKDSVSTHELCNGKSALDVAVDCGNSKAVSLLLGTPHIIIPPYDEDDETHPLNRALDGGYLDIALDLMQYVELTEEQKQFILTSAVDKGWKKIVEYLLEDGVDANLIVKGEEEDIPLLQIALQGGHDSTARLLIEQGNLSTFMLQVCIRVALENNKAELVRLIASRINIFKIECIKWTIHDIQANELTPFAMAAKNGIIELVRLFLTFPYNDTTKYKISLAQALIQSIKAGHVAVIETLLTVNADHFLAEVYNKEFIDELLSSEYVIQFQNLIAVAIQRNPESAARTLVDTSSLSQTAVKRAEGTKRTIDQDDDNYALPADKHAKIPSAGAHNQEEGGQASLMNSLEDDVSDDTYA